MTKSLRKKSIIKKSRFLCDLFIRGSLLSNFNIKVRFYVYK